MYQGSGAKQIRVVRVSLGPVHERPEPASEIERERIEKIGRNSGGRDEKLRNSSLSRTAEGISVGGTQ